MIRVKYVKLKEEKTTEQKNIKGFFSKKEKQKLEGRKITILRPGDNGLNRWVGWWGLRRTRGFRQVVK